MWYTTRQLRLNRLSIGEYGFGEILADFPQDVAETLAFERGKLEHPERRYAARVREEFGGTFAEKGLVLAKTQTEEANV